MRKNAAGVVEGASLGRGAMVPTTQVTWPLATSTASPPVSLSVKKVNDKTTATQFLQPTHSLMCPCV